MIRRPPRSTLDRSSAASDVYKRQASHIGLECALKTQPNITLISEEVAKEKQTLGEIVEYMAAVSYTHLRAHETVLDLVCRLLLEKTHYDSNITHLWFDKLRHSKC